MKKRVVIFASGSGTNAENIIRYFKGKKTAEVVMVFCNTKNAGVLGKATQHKVPTQLFSKADLYENGHVAAALQDLRPDGIVLAGFLWMFPANLLKLFPDKVLNIHPALLPKYGGKGMYGMHIHRAVVANKETETGITIHYVNEHYDEGKILFQAKTPVAPTDTPETVAEKIRLLEERYFPEIIEKVLVEADGKS